MDACRAIRLDLILNSGLGLGSLLSVLDSRGGKNHDEAKQRPPTEIVKSTARGAGAGAGAGGAGVALALAPASVQAVVVAADTGDCPYYSYNALPTSVVVVVVVMVVVAAAAAVALAVAAAAAVVVAAVMEVAILSEKRKQ